MTSGRTDFLEKIQCSVLVILTLKYVINIQERLSGRPLDTCLEFQEKVYRRDIMGVIAI